jgi:O-antigen/teichoic acid export membrane protein
MSYVGVYAVAYTLGTSITMLFKPISTNLLAPISKAYDEKKHNEVKKYIKYAVRYFIMLALPAVAGLAMISAPLTDSLTTPEFLVGSFGVTAIIAIATIFDSLFSINMMLLLLEKRVYAITKLFLIAAFLNLVLNAVLIPLFGLIGAAVATFLSFFTGFFLSYLSMRHYIKLSIELIFLIKSILSSSLIVAFLYILPPSGWVNILISIAVSALIYFTSMYALKAFRKNELNFFKSFLRTESDSTGVLPD